jgi:two-component system, chemotaxis family, protein-glutamate methylesterase/glutaminase
VPGRDIVVIGASAGGVEALRKICSILPPDLPAAIFVVLHTTASAESRLPYILDRAGSMTASHPEDGTKIEHGNIYVARPNRHMLIEDGHIRLTAGPRRNGYRPSINTLFESAASSYGARVIGIVLSGSLDDGTLGLLHIKRSGGVALVQSPDEAMFKGMPTSALERVEVDFVGPVQQIASRLEELVRALLEVNTGKMVDGNEHLSSGSNPGSNPSTNLSAVTGFTCPDCGGVLEEKRAGNYFYFRCHVGHEVSERSLLQTQGQEIETALWTALRILEERVALGRRIEQRAIERDNVHTLQRIRNQNQEALRNAEVIRRVLQGANPEQSITVLQDDIGGEFDPEEPE